MIGIKESSSRLAKPTKVSSWQGVTGNSWEEQVRGQRALMVSLESFESTCWDLRIHNQFAHVWWNTCKKGQEESDVSAHSLPGEHTPSWGREQKLPLPSCSHPHATIAHRTSIGTRGQSTLEKKMRYRLILELSFLPLLELLKKINEVTVWLPGEFTTTHTSPWIIKCALVSH